MEKAPAELMKEYVNSQKFSSTTEIMEAMKAMFGDVLQQVMEAELDAKLGYEKAKEYQIMTKTVCRKITVMGTQKRR